MAANAQKAFLEKMDRYMNRIEEQSKRLYWKHNFRREQFKIFCRAYFPDCVFSEFKSCGWDGTDVFVDRIHLFHMFCYNSFDSYYLMGLTPHMYSPSTTDLNEVKKWIRQIAKTYTARILK